MFDFIIENISKLFVKDYTKDGYLKKILTTPDKDSWSDAQFVYTWEGDGRLKR